MKVYTPRVKDLERFGEPLKFIPVGFVVAIVGMLYSIYMRLHALPMLNSGSWSCAVVFNALTSMLLLCYARCILVSPGTVPDSEHDASWTCQPKGAAHAEQFAVGGSSLAMQEAKRSGDKRNCKWCAKYKPDRCHHCRVCRTCVLKMDHHCPWIYNCVGFGNHKYFFLLLVYTVASCWFIALTMMGTVRSSLDSRTYFLTMFSLLFGQTLSVLLGCVASAFLGFHVWLMFRGMTTIEFCEKSMRRAGYDGSLYDRGAWGNVCAVLGNKSWLWLLPVNPPSGTGLDFSGEETPLLLNGVSLKAVGKFAEPVPTHRSRNSANAGSAGTGSAPTSDAEGS